MPKTFICGHGAWNPSDGYVSVPAGTSISFYTQNSKWMCSTDAYKLIQGTFTGPVQQECGPYKTAPNMRVFPDDPECKAYSISVKPDGVDLYFTDVATGVTLKDIFQQHPGNEFVWACCRDLGLRNVVPRGVTGHTGVNLEERVDGFYDYNFTTQQYSKIWSK